MKPGIYLEITPASTFGSIGSATGKFDLKHAYLVYRKPDGTSEIIRGGLGENAKLTVETQKSLENSKDKLGPDEKPGTRPSRRLDIPTDKLEDTWSKMRDKAEAIGKERLNYRADPSPADPDNPDQTSNSVVRAALDDAGIPLEKALPDGVDLKQLPGIHDNLDEKIKETRRERNIPNPIEGEMGGTDDQNPTPFPSGDSPGYGNNGPTGQDDGADDDSPPSGSSSGSDSSGASQPQSANLTDPEAPSRTMELKLGEEGKSEPLELILGPDGEPISKERTPDQNLLLKDISKSDGPLDEILAKDPRDLTEGEFVALKKEIINLPAGPEQDRLDGMATAFLEHRFGDGPAKFDAVGRMIDAKPIRPANKTPVPAKTPDGEPLTGAVKKIGGVIADAAGSEGRASAVRGLQSGLNLLKSIMQRSAKSSQAKALPLTHDLKTDGVVGPKTRRALRLAATRLGRPKVEEGFALGRFGNFARDIHSGRADTRSLKPTIDKAFGPLFRSPRAPRQQPSRPAEENLSFQATVNDLGSDVFGRDAFKPVKEDGFIGPKTESAFNSVLPAAGPDRFTSRLGHNLGFFDDNDFGDFG